MRICSVCSFCVSSFRLWEMLVRVLRIFFFGGLRRVWVRMRCSLVWRCCLLVRFICGLISIGYVSCVFLIVCIWVLSGISIIRYIMILIICCLRLCRVISLIFFILILLISVLCLSIFWRFVLIIRILLFCVFMWGCFMRILFLRLLIVSGNICIVMVFVVSLLMVFFSCGFILSVIVIGGDVLGKGR